MVTESTQRRLNRRALAIEGSGDGLWDIDPLEGMIWLSRRAAAMLRIGHRDMILSLGAAEHHINPSDLVRLRTLAGTFRVPGGRAEAEIRLRTSGGGTLWVQLRGTVTMDIAGGITRISGSMRDISSKKRDELDLHHAAHHDELTGLPNRLALTQALEDAVHALARNPARTFAVLYLDVDRFKLVNDSLGHETGDQLLRAMGGRIRGVLRPSDFLARLGGDEFAAIINNIADEQAAKAVAARIGSVLESAFRLGDMRVFASASIGIVLGDSRRPPDQHLRHADTAMYSAKRAGAGENKVYREGLSMAARGRLHLESDLHRALDEGEFHLEYQPIVALPGAELRGLEALVRWVHPERGLIPPSEFIPVAEEIGLIRRLGQWVMQEAAHQAAMLRRELIAGGYRPITMSVNVSPREFREPGLPDRVQTALSNASLPPSELVVEITEGCMIDEDATIALLNELKDVGVRLAVDDFGTGYSSLSYLTRLPLDILKIDQSFVAALGSGHPDESVVRAIVSLGRGLDLSVTAEGIESAAQLDFLARQGCHFGQGYLIARPAPLGLLSDLPPHLNPVKAS